MQEIRQNTNLRAVVNENKKITNRHQHYLSHVQTFLTDADEYFTKRVTGVYKTQYFGTLRAIL